MSECQALRDLAKNATEQQDKQERLEAATALSRMLDDHGVAHDKKNILTIRRDVNWVEAYVEICDLTFHTEMMTNGKYKLYGHADGESVRINGLGEVDALFKELDAKKARRKKLARFLPWVKV